MEQVNEYANGEIKTVVAIDPRDEAILGYQQAIVASADVIEKKDNIIEKSDRKIQIMRKELEQYRNDLVFWSKAHGAEYPVRRITELDKKLQEIEQV